MVKSMAIATAVGAALTHGSDFKWKADLMPRGGSQVTGNAEVESRSIDSTRMEIEIKGDAGTSYQWHLHTGSCATDGPVVGMASAYPELRTNASGKAEATVTLGVAPPASAGAYSIHVHGPATMAAPADSMRPEPATVSCGDLRSSQ